MLKKILDSLYQRVFVAKKSSLAALGLAAADAVVSVLQSEPIPQWAHILVGLAASVLLLYKGKAQPALPDLKPVP